jgi:hypothetical protein
MLMISFYVWQLEFQDLQGCVIMQVEQLEQEVAVLQQALIDKQDQEAAMLQVLCAPVFSSVYFCKLICRSK